jgi:hypothetical protein
MRTLHEITLLLDELDRRIAALPEPVIMNATVVSIGRPPRPAYSVSLWNVPEEEMLGSKTRISGGSCTLTEIRRHV